MKTRFSPFFSLCLVLAILPALAGCSKSDSSAQKAAVEPQPALMAATDGTEEEAPTESSDKGEGQDIAEATVRSVSTDKPVPPGVQLNPAIEEVIRLADARVHESVMLTYVTNSAVAFELGADEIIYLNDLGVPSEVVTAMLTRDGALREYRAESTLRRSNSLFETIPPRVTTKSWGNFASKKASCSLHVMLSTRPSQPGPQQ